MHYYTSQREIWRDISRAEGEFLTADDSTISTFSCLASCNSDRKARKPEHAWPFDIGV